jgi:hypothetical protein
MVRVGFNWPAHENEVTHFALREHSGNIRAISGNRI